MNEQLTLLSPNKTLVSAGKSACIHQVFEAQAARTPDGIAVSNGDEKLTYRELNERSNQVAGYLRAKGIGPESHVALYLERSANMVVAILGVLKAGAAYVPIDLAYPRDRLEFMLQDAEATVLITQSSLKSALPEVKAELLCLDTDAEDLSERSGDNLPSLTTPSNAAYIIYTSGSTGKPKGVIVTHHNVVRLLRSTAHWYRFNEKDVWPLFHSYAFDVSVWELWGSLFNGGRLVIVPYLVSRSPHDFYELLAREKVTVLNQTPSAFRQLIWAEETAEVKREIPLRYVVCAGEALELQSLKPWFDRHGDEQPQIVNMYGITETTVHSTFRIIRKADLTSGVGSVIGVPIPDLQLYLVDEDLKLVPKGVPGEICVGGAGVARGYLNRPDLTAKRFLPDPFSGEPGATLYRSGDLAQYGPSGEMEYLGRMDHQVKIRGFRVELGEIESALNRHEAIRESVVIAADGGDGGKRLLAYVVPHRIAPNVSDLRIHLGKNLPDYMIPAVFVSLEKLPLTTNGKVDRRALPSPEGQRPELKSDYVAPRNPNEEILAGICKEVLGLNQVGIHDNLFELGGDSIRSITILSKAKALGVRLTLDQVFRFPTVAGLAACAAQPAQPAAKLTAPFSLVTDEDRGKMPQDVEDAYAIGRLQLGMFFHNELNPLSAVYHDVFSFRIRSPFDQEKLNAAIQMLVARHPILRTSFHIAGFSEPLQLVHKKATAAFTVEDLRAVEAAAQQKQIVHWIETEKRRPFDRLKAPLVRFHAMRLSDDQFQLVISFHHSCLDGWSLAAVMTEVCQDYRALLTGQSNAIPSPRITYRDFISLEHQVIASEDARKFWREKFEGTELQVLPRWPENQRAGGHEQVRGPEVIIDSRVFNGLRQIAQRAGVPLKTVLLAAHHKVMSALYGQSDVTSGMLFNGRPEELDGEKLIGLFLNTLPIRMQLNGGTWTELVKQAFAAEQEIIPLRRFPMAEIQKLHGGRALFESAFDFVHFHVYKNLQEFQDLDFREGHYFEANDLTAFTSFIMDVDSKKLEFHIDYDPTKLCRKQVEQMSDYYVEVLAAMTADPESRYETCSPLPCAERKMLVEEWNKTARDYPREATIHELFEAQAEANAEETAVICERRSATYRELNEMAEAVAQELIRSGAGPGSLVGIFTERSVEMMAGLFGILKAGAAYVPLDPSFPAERIEYMIHDARVPVVLTESHLVASLPKSDAKVVCIDKLSPQSPVRRPKQDSSSLAYVIYTSGSTGTPKGVRITHRSVVNLLVSASKTAGITKADSLLAVTTLSFDIAALELFTPLILGGKLVLASRTTASDASQLATALEASRASVMQATPATWRMLIDSGWKGDQKLKIICGGESLKRELANELLDRAKEVWNFYGPTETTIWSTAWKVQRDGPILIGRPLANTTVYILDSQLQPLPPGVTGELYLGGDGVAAGYHNLPELTAQKFIADPFRPGAKIYRTGDLARYQLDGSVECLGRTDHQVKIRGFRIETGEVETVLKQHHGVADAIVKACDQAGGEKRLVGYVISKSGPPSVSELRQHIESKLPRYMVPSHFVVLKAFPLTPNGKIDQRRLPLPEEVDQPERIRVAPRTTDEEALATIWREILLLNQLGVEDNFFELGGDSLAATRTFARINKTFGTRISLREMMDNPTIASLAGVVRNSRENPAIANPIMPRRRSVAQI